VIVELASLFLGTFGLILGNLACKVVGSASLSRRDCHFPLLLTDRLAIQGCRTGPLVPDRTMAHRRLFRGHTARNEK
jgi:hypothetical protein